MIDLSPGMRVIIRDEEWLVKKVETNSLDKKTIYCTGISKLVKDHPAIFLADLEDIEIVDPKKVKLIIDDSHFYKKSRLFIESQWRQKTPSDSALHIGNRAAMDFIPFQLEPAYLSLQRPRQRILIADSVGLGKTLEAGILIAELIARGKGKRILVITVKSMMTQFQKEMWNRFTIPLVRLDSNKIQKVRSQLPSNYNPFFYYDKTIISIDTLKRDLEYRTHLENSWWDIIVIDEAHNVADRGKKQAQRSKLAQLLSERSDTLIMLSATPHDGKAESFASLMNMLDRTAIANPSKYTKEDIKGLCIRRFKKDIKEQISGEFKERKVTIEKCSATPTEEFAYDFFTQLHLIMDKENQEETGQLFKTSLEKSMFSSPAACIKSIEERIKKLRKKYKDEDFQDIAQLEGLREALVKIDSHSFSRYVKLLELLNRQDYGWSSKKNNDRIVIFTERIETMKYLVDHLRIDLKLNEKAVEELYGGMSDIEQQKIVEDFGREESPIRILVASDVASEGINLHYLSHRIIHFDIPWSLMVFQQRNGRIDRYGQHEQPDIRYFLINSTNEEIKGDMRILEILVQKEEQANQNIGDPALLLGKFNIEEEELMTAQAIEKNVHADEFSKQIDDNIQEFNPFEILMGSSKKAMKTDICEEETFYKDIDYLRSAIQFFSHTQNIPLRNLETVEGLEIDITEEIKKHLTTVIPSEALPECNFLRLSPDKDFCMDEMKRSMQRNMSESTWPATQYLWPLHPIFEWVNDKAGLLFNRGTVPLIPNPDMPSNNYIFIIAGLIPNRKSAPVVNEWFGLHFSNGIMVKELTMEEIIEESGFGRKDLPNTTNNLSLKSTEAENMLESAVYEAKKVLDRYCKKYQKEIEPKINEELDKLVELESRHKSYFETLFPNLRKKSEEERKVEKIFTHFSEWVKDTLEIENNPYIRIVAVLMGV